MSSFSNEFTVAAEERFSETGFRQRSLADLNLPDILTIETIDQKPVRLQIHGDLRGARAVLLNPLPFSTRLEDESQQVHLAAQQDVLGAEFCVVGVQTYDPVDAKYSSRELWRIGHGDFQPMADRLLTAEEALDIDYEQDLVLHGGSLAGDIVIETANQVLTDKNRGLRRIDRLGAVDYTRGKNRLKLMGAFQVMNAFGRSGEELYTNIVAGGSVALLEACQIEPSDPGAKKKFDKATQRGVIAYARKDLIGMFAGFAGAAKNTSTTQLNTIGVVADGPITSVVRLDESLLCSTDDLVQTDRLTISVEPGDHSTANNIKREAAFVLRTVAA